MDVLIRKLSEFNISRIRNSIRPPVVIHCVPGAGKSSCIRSLIREDPRFTAFTRGVPDKPHISGTYIRPLPESLPIDRLVLLDEYTLGDSIPQGIFAVFGDPSQSPTGFCLPADFLGKVSRRFGRNTAALLRSLDFEVEADGEDEVQIQDIFVGDLEGKVIFHEKEVGCLLARHSVEALDIADIQGQTFDCVTFVTTGNSPVDRVRDFQCLTRHRKKLKILCPDATYSST